MGHTNVIETAIIILEATKLVLAWQYTEAAGFHKIIFLKIFCKLIGKHLSRILLNKIVLRVLNRYSSNSLSV